MKIINFKRKGVFLTIYTHRVNLYKIKINKIRNRFLIYNN